ncbi:UvrB/UvrC motif-containing protein [Clostridium sp. D2Q-14]|uniref:UvrB/UvrC motif-containing protein n=1 Tax=Anaeromonas gelatinilytica TaxID=2683194 RepID=UPI00193C0427|nr:UvrB/UvrC motif-containing protein [Anaeromonas gelatinilytica]MBS4535027.1 UvrB/UvrC motif-containing protein [Anaeromonas gelatinilytica]
MMCEKCGESQATVHYTEIINGHKSEVHLCEKCAGEKEVGSHFSINHLLAGLLDNQIDGNMKIDYVEPQKCKVCGMTYNRFKETGKLGCSECYSTFNDRLNSLYKRIHGHDVHVGKIPIKSGKSMKVKKDIEKLQLELKEAIENEEFENAAILRDKIKKLEKNIKE